MLKTYEEITFIDFKGLPDPEKGLKFTLAFQFRDTDILQCSYPKSGFHWMSNMLWRLKSEDDSRRPQDQVIEFAAPETYEVQLEPRIIITFMRAWRVQHFQDKGKIVLMLRNPKDIAVSFYNHMKNAKAFKNPQTWDEFFSSYIKGEVMQSSIFEYLRSWEQALKNIADGKINLKVEVFYYEEFLQNPRENLARLNKYLGFNRGEEYLERVLKETTLGALKDKYNCAKETSNALCTDDEGNSIIFRKGEVGDWKNYFTVAQSELVDKLLDESLQHGLIKFKFEL